MPVCSIHRAKGFGFVAISIAFSNFKTIASGKFQKKRLALARAPHARARGLWRQNPKGWRQHEPTPESV